ncbi:GAF domain-containing protein [Pseudanabaenaceae cyanobacterium LEGE 13415]|nr:GAF domain-containing protein [Pseudanabaenaceae cyanobacterium LEGE 13415]
MTPDLADTLRNLCRDEAAFQQLQQTLAGEVQPLEQQIDRSNFLLERQKTLSDVIARLRQPLDLDEIFKATAAEVRQLLAADRVGMFRFHPESGFDDGEFVSEDVDSEFESAIAKKVHDHCFGEQFAAHYEQGRAQNVADIYNAGLSDCHIQVLAQFQVRANLVVPLLQGRHLWGLLCIHQCRAPRHWQDTEIEFIQQIADHLGVALQHAELLAELRAEITERQQAEQRAQELNQGLEQAIVELRTVNQELEAFSYSVSHDLRTPLRSIDGFSQALLEDCLDQLDSTGQGYLQRIRAAAQRMEQLIDDLLNLSRVTRSDLRIESVDLSRLASRICSQLQQANLDRQVDIEIQPNLNVQGDTRLLQVALENLLNNSWKFTNQQAVSRIELGVLPPNAETDRRTYFVRDNGIGFDMAYVDKLFKPFQRLHRVHEFPGNGIGLATIQRIIHRHGGRVWAEAALDQGATFYFTLVERKE